MMAYRAQVVVSAPNGSAVRHNNRHFCALNAIGPPLLTASSNSSKRVTTVFRHRNYLKIAKSLFKITFGLQKERAFVRRGLGTGRINAIQELVTSDEYRHVPTGTLARIGSTKPGPAWAKVQSGENSRTKVQNVVKHSVADILTAHSGRKSAQW
ncbi:hypothetical protein ETAA8_23080 [Anatilimnocola aggregata]|uniref:Uncharacterized protein n=1 Tax=Anatilimnocola aggregata TaxID=2528021 RepID=A0A517YAP4_9BACT|nr:hypothetical protein ETAA8_23080 [Anatilimnocola aggregata]